MSDGKPDQDNALDQLAHLFQQQERAGETVVPFTPPAARTAAAAAVAPAPDLPPTDAQARKSGKAKKDKAPKTPRAYMDLGDDCPVQPLGVNGSDYYFLDAIDQLNIKNADKLGQNGIDDLFKHSAAQRWADANFGRKGEDGVINGIDRDLLKRALIAKCGDLSENGVFDPSGRIRGDGGWKDETGRLVFHCGDVILVADSKGRLHERRPGIHDHLIYPKGSRQLRPADAKDAIAGEHGPGNELLNMIATWNWKRGVLDAMLALGWQTLAPVGGALRWRPSMWTTGDSGTGKSTLLEVYQGVQGGDRGMIRAANATGAGIWQSLGFRSLPAVVDELEAGKNNEAKASLIDLMKISSSGDKLRRGGSDHKSVEFNAYSPFHFSSVLILPLAPEEINRMALLELQDLSPAQRLNRPRIDQGRMAQIGAALRMRMALAWPRWEEHLAVWQEPIAKEFTARTADTFGFLLAAAHIALCDEVAHPDTVEETIAPLIPSLRQWQEVAGKDYQLMLSHLGTWQLEPWDKGRKITIRSLVHWASARAKSSAEYSNGADAEDVERFGDHLPRGRAAAALRANGLAVISSRKGDDQGTEYLAIAYRHSSLARIFRGTKWQDGVWRQSATRAPGADTRKVRIEGGAEGTVCVPIAAILGEEGG